MMLKERIEAKLGMLQKYRNRLETYRYTSLHQLENDFTLCGAVERYLQLCLEIVLEIGQMIIGAEGFRKPYKNREVIEILGEGRILPAVFAKRFAPAGGFRNVLVHEYGEVEIPKLHKYLRHNLKDLDTFARHISAYLRKLKE